ncbi:MAG TPA: hypothetical protein VJL81_03095 [Solirubrobacterales bacterium]|nr:hypothetical protein [Solirubrobacterales bacterium]
MAPWKLPLLVLAIAVPIVAGTLLGGPGTGLALAALVAVAIVYWAVQMRPRGGIGEAPDTQVRRRLLVVVSRPVEDEATTTAIAVEAGIDGTRDLAEVMVLAPLRIGFLDRWASDLEPAQEEAQKSLVISVASLARVGVVAEARVGDEDIVQAVEDQVGSYAATEVILVTAPDDEDPDAAHAAAELTGRLRTEFRRLVVAGPAGDGDAGPGGEG